MSMFVPFDFAKFVAPANIRIGPFLSDNSPLAICKLIMFIADVPASVHAVSETNEIDRSTLVAGRVVAGTS